MPRLLSGQKTFCRATKTMLAAIKGSTICDGSRTMSKTESVSVIVCASVKAAMILNNSQKRRTASASAAIKQKMIVTSEDVIDPVAHIIEEGPQHARARVRRNDQRRF